MTRGIVFDIEEFAVYDGPGIRSVIFLKGCPLRCQWCHNPEGLSLRPQLLKSRDLCIHCGACEAVCAHKEGCVACGECVKVCPRGCLRIAGHEMTPEQAALRVKRNARMLLKLSGGGVTFSGGEATMQAEFVLETRALLKELHAVTETSGYCDSRTFDRIVDAMDMVLFDVKLVDSQKHRHYTGVDNYLILENLSRLMALGKPFRVRVPLIPTVNDTRENLEATARLLEGAKGLDRVELLSYNRSAGAKYGQVGQEYKPEFPEDQKPNAWTDPFTRRGMEVITV